ncbi:MAG: LPS export ABC transporter permease LptG [Burkholderiales bacterium]|nr:MAG: LPS export ABC transporter permease LptG [Burkholderiales bacterium]
MKVLRRYVAREIYLATGLVFAALISLFIIFDLIHELSDVGKSAYRVSQAVAYVLLSVPGHAYELFPIAALIGTVVALSQLAAHSELTVIRASGVSLYRLALAVCLAGLTLALITLVVGEFIAPASDRAAQRLRLRATSTVVGQEFRSGLWVKDEGSFINVRQVHLDFSLRGVKIFQFDDGFHLRSISFAERGEYLGDHWWSLSNVVRTEFQGTESRVVKLPQERWRSVLSPEVINVLLVDPHKMTLANLWSYIQHLRENRQNSTRFEIALWRKVVYPGAVLVMMLLAIPFAQHQRRAGGVGARVFIAIMVGLGFHLLNRLFAHLGVLNEWPPALSGMGPTAAFLGLAFAAMWWVERR